MNLGYVSRNGGSRSAGQQLGYASGSVSRSAYERMANMNPTGKAPILSPTAPNKDRCSLGSCDTVGPSRRPTSRRGNERALAGQRGDRAPVGKHSSTASQQMLDALTSRVDALEKKVEEHAAAAEAAENDLEVVVSTLQSLSGGVPWRYAKAGRQLSLYGSKKQARRGDESRAAAVVDEGTWVLLTNHFSHKESTDQKNKDENTLYVVHEVVQDSGLCERLYATHYHPKHKYAQFSSFAVFPNDDVEEEVEHKDAVEPDTARAD